MNMSKFSRQLFTLAVLLASANALAQTASAHERTHAVPSVGAMKEITDAGEKPDPQQVYKIVFDVQTLADSNDEVSPALQAMGGLINTYTAYGVPVSHLIMTAVFHGRTIVLVTRDDIYRQRTGSTSNPNVEIIRELEAVGVRMVVCGQSALGQRFVQEDYLSGIATNLSATVTFLNLQTQGYVKIVE